MTVNNRNNNNNLALLIIPEIINGFVKGECGLVSEHVHSRLACYKPIIYSLIKSTFNTYDYCARAPKVKIT